MVSGSMGRGGCGNHRISIYITEERHLECGLILFIFATMQLFQWSSIYLYSFVLKWLWKSMNLMKNDGCVRKQFFHWNWKQLSSTIAKMGTIALCNWIPFPDIYCPIKKLCVIFVVTGTLGLCGNLWVIVVILSSKSMRKKLINILFTSQSCLDFSCGLLLILTCQDKTFAPSGGHFGIAG